MEESEAKSQPLIEVDELISNNENNGGFDENVLGNSVNNLIDALSDDETCTNIENNLVLPGNTDDKEKLADGESIKNEQSHDNSLDSPDRLHETMDEEKSQDIKTTSEPSKKKCRMEIDMDLDFKFEDVEFNEDGSCRRYKKRDRRTIVKYDNKEAAADEQSMKRPTKKQKVQINSEESEHACVTCRATFQTVQALISHRKSHRAPAFTCAQCRHPADSNQELIAHKASHAADDRSFLCLKCEAAFTDHLAYLRHRLTHSKAHTFACDECGKTYHKRTSFLIHIETHFDTSTECPVCHRIVKSHGMKGHMAIHGAQKQCGECGKRYPNKKTLDHHMVSHTGLKVHQCLYCGRGFARAQARDTHARVHTGERPYSCELCHQTFRQQTDVKRHRVSHDTAKRLECPVCHKRFYHAVSLRDHMDIHAGTQKYTCRLCGAKYHTHTSLRNHLLRAHTAGRPYACEPCGKAFRTPQDLRKHTKCTLHKNTVYGLHNKIKRECED